jgi:hypothetical protein
VGVGGSNFPKILQRFALRAWREFLHLFASVRGVSAPRAWHDEFDKTLPLFSDR